MVLGAVQIGGYKMKKREEYIVRKELGFLRKSFHFLLYLLMWLFILFIILVNVNFLLGYYSDDMVSFYLLFNLDYGLYTQLIVAMIILIVITAIYSTFRLRYLRRENKHVQNH